MFKTQKLFLAVILAASTSAFALDFDGGSSNQNKVNTESLSNAIPFGAGAIGLRFDNNNKLSNSINLANGPIKFIRQKHAQAPINGNNPNANVNGLDNPRYLTFSDINPVIGFFNRSTLGQVWYERRAHNTDVYSIRQIADPKLPIAPKFGGLVIAQVPSDVKVYFGEWAPRSNNPSQSSDTDLGMNSNQRTVWYVGENPTRNMPRLVNAQYDVLGVNQHTPGQNDFYTGTLTANFGTGSGTLTGNIARGNDAVDFAGTRISQDGKFSRGNDITGRFYGDQAQALAGMVNREGTDKDIAFGGAKR